VPAERRHPKAAYSRCRPLRTFSPRRQRSAAIRRAGHEEAFGQVAGNRSLSVASKPEVICAGPCWSPRTSYLLPARPSARRTVRPGRQRCRKTHHAGHNTELVTPGRWRMRAITEARDRDIGTACVDQPVHQIDPDVVREAATCSAVRRAGRGRRCEVVGAGPSRGRREAARG
jgi:hypothetical protein